MPTETETEGLEEIRDRLGIVESILGIDPAGMCRGDPEECGSACRADSCPLTMNAVTRISGQMKAVLDDLRLLRHWARELEMMHIVPDGAWARAEARADLERLEHRLDDARIKLMNIELSGVTGSLLVEVRRRVGDLALEVSRAREKLTDLGKRMLKPIEIKVNNETRTVRCRHAADWPPTFVQLGMSSEALRSQGLITDLQYEQAKTWERVCGLMEMSTEKCPSCPFAMHEAETERPQPSRPRPKKRMDGR